MFYVKRDFKSNNPIYWVPVLADPRPNNTGTQLNSDLLSSRSQRVGFDYFPIRRFRWCR